MAWKAILVFCASIYIASAKHEKYDGYAVYDISVNTIEEANLLTEIEKKLDLDVWAHATPGRTGQILVPKHTRFNFQDVMTSNGLQFNVAVDNIKEKLDHEDKILAAKKGTKSGADAYLTPDTIYNYEEINEHLEVVARLYPERVTLLTAGQSFEGRDIKYLKVSSSNFEDTSKPIIMLESLIHAREWVTQPATLTAINRLIVNITEHDLIDKADWIIVPIVNPDGFQYTHDSDRFWRKNRATGYFTGDICLGVDLNRNFDFNWGSESSSLTCSETFHGGKPNSEPETRAIDSIIQEYKDRIKLFIDIHSYGSYILYGYGTAQLPPNGLVLNLVGVQMGQTIDSVKWSKHRNYTVGNSAMVLYGTSGSAQDYVQYQGIPLSYTFELPGYNNLGSTIGFLVETEFIEQAGYETWEGIKVGARFVINNNL